MAYISKYKTLLFILCFYVQIQKRLTDMRRYWPNIVSGRNEMAFWTHEWRVHGKFTGLTADEYFSLGLELAKMQDVTKILNDASISADNNATYSLSQIQTAVKNKLGHIPSVNCVRASGNLYDIFEIHICVEKVMNDILLIPDYVDCTSAKTTCGFSTTRRNLRLLPAST